MIRRHMIKEEQAFYAIENKEFSSEIIGSNDDVVIVLTQDWCPQWKALKKYLYGLNIDENIDIYELEYNKTNYFEEFKAVKENDWNNYTIPYLRFYRNGTLVAETNYINEETFIKIVTEKRGNI